MEALPSVTQYDSLLIVVMDENDETPLFDPSNVNVPLMEDKPIGTLVHKFTATDRDALSTPRNSEIE